MKMIRVIIKDFAYTKTENGLEYKETVFPLELPYSKENMAWAEENCYEGTPEVFDWQEPIPEPTQLDVIEAQMAYIAMMTDTLLEV